MGVLFAIAGLCVGWILRSILHKWYYSQSSETTVPARDTCISLRRSRRISGVSLTELAKEMKLTEVALRDFEAGHTANLLKDTEAYYHALNRVWDRRDGASKGRRTI